MILLFIRYIIIIILSLILYLNIIKCQLNNNIDKLNSNNYNYFPKQIKSYHRRRDVYTGELVKRGQLEKLKDYILVHKSISYNEFHRILQCPVSEPGLNGMRASISYFKLFPPTRQSLLLTAVNLESDCLTLDVCRKQLDNYNDGNIPDNLIGKTSSPYQVRLIRLINGSFFYDWPFNRQRFDEIINHKSFHFLDKLIKIINDLPDSVFFHGEELPFIDNNFPFISFTSSPTTSGLEIVNPWMESINQEIIRHYKAFLPRVRDINEFIAYNSCTCPQVSTTSPKDYNIINDKLIRDNALNVNCSYSDKFYNQYHSKDYIDWISRLSKVGFYGTLMESRQILFDLSKLYPNLIDARWNYGINEISPWNPESEESIPKDNDIESIHLSNHNKSNNLRVGYLESLFSLKLNRKVDFLKIKYKYLIVLLGLNGEATAGKLAGILANSGAVTLLQISDYEYHFTPRLKPWVHYIPVSYNIADIVDKIEWLENHPQLAYRIAMNAKAFGESYLRLEDYYCYYGTFFKTIGSLLNGSDALIPFDPMPIKVDSDNKIIIDSVCFGVDCIYLSFLSILLLSVSSLLYVIFCLQ